MNHTPHGPSHPGAGQTDIHPHVATAAGASTAEAEAAPDTGRDPGTDQAPAPGFAPAPDAMPFPPEGVGYAGHVAPAPPAVPARRGGRPIIAGIVAAAVIATVAVGLRGGGDDGAGSGTDAAGEPTGEPSSGVDDLPSNAGPVQTADDSNPFFESGTPEVEVVDQGFSSFDGQSGIEASWAVVVENSGDASTSLLRVDVEFKDAAGALIASDSQLLKRVPAGEEMGVAHEFLPGDLPAHIDSMEVTLGEAQPAFAGGPEGAFTISGVTVSLVDQAVINGWRAVFTIDSSYDTTRNHPDLYAVFRDADGKIVGGAFTVHGTVPPGTSAGEITSYAPTPGVVSADIYLVAAGG